MTGETVEDCEKNTKNNALLRINLKMQTVSLTFWYQRFMNEIKPKAWGGGGGAIIF